MLWRAMDAAADANCLDTFFTLPKEIQHLIIAYTEAKQVLIRAREVVAEGEKIDVG